MLWRTEAEEAEAEADSVAVAAADISAVAASAAEAASAAVAVSAAVVISAAAEWAIWAAVSAIPASDSAAALVAAYRESAAGSIPLRTKARRRISEIITVGAFTLASIADTLAGSTTATMTTTA